MPCCLSIHIMTHCMPVRICALCKVSQIFVIKQPRCLAIICKDEHQNCAAMTVCHSITPYLSRCRYPPAEKCCDSIFMCGGGQRTALAGVIYLVHPHSQCGRRIHAIICACASCRPTPPCWGVNWSRAAHMLSGCIVVHYDEIQWLTTAESPYMCKAAVHRHHVSGSKFAHKLHCIT